MLSRRTFLQVIAYSAAARLHAADSVLPSAAKIPTLDDMDGYHGGVRGHMPEGCWRDILSAMREFPDWKISLDVEASLWEVLRRQDPQAYEELAAYLKDRSSNARVEMVAGTFAQPYGWAISGESNFRQLQRGLQVIQQQFPGIEVLTYAVQEPCWASCLPQILRSFNFDGAALKDASTAWGGYAAGLDADLFHWIGPDGTPITTVPRYAVEKLQKVYETESVDATAEFSEKCVEHGILIPQACVSRIWDGRRSREFKNRYCFATWHEYIQNIASQPTKSWRFGIEDILVTLPWGDPNSIEGCAAGPVCGKPPCHGGKNLCHRLCQRAFSVARGRVTRGVGLCVTKPGSRCMDHGNHAPGTPGMGISSGFSHARCPGYSRPSD